MQTTNPDLGPQTAEVARIVAGVRDDQLPGPTPCPDMDVAALLDHYFQGVEDDATVSRLRESR